MDQLEQWYPIVLTQWDPVALCPITQHLLISFVHFLLILVLLLIKLVMVNLVSGSNTIILLYPFNLYDLSLGYSGSNMPSMQSVGGGAPGVGGAGVGGPQGMMRPM